MKNRKGRLLEEDLEVGATRRGVVEKTGAFDWSIAVVNKLQKATKLTTRTRIHIFINIYVFQIFVFMQNCISLNGVKPFPQKIRKVLL